jgi:hypothetical protein
MRKTAKRSLTIATAVVISVAGGTAAFAYASGWFKGGGTVSATSSTIGNVTTTVVLANSSATRLFPGRELPVTGNIANPNDYKVKINNVSVTEVTATKVNGSSNPNCNKDTADLSASLTTPLQIANETTLTNQSFGKVKMGENASAACAGSAITATLTFAGELVPNS